MKFFIHRVIYTTLVLGTFSMLGAATVTLSAIYKDSGGNAGNMNSVGDQVNGRNICPAVNTNANTVPGCDMSADVGLDNNSTADLEDDYYTGDMIVRTNDTFGVDVGYSWLGNAGGAEEQVTLTGVLPAGAGFIWPSIPGVCNQTESSISTDEKTIICVRKDMDTNDAGSFSENIVFPVKVEGDAANGSQPGYVEFTIDTPSNDAAPTTDSTQTSNPADQDKMIVTASPRWNIDLRGSAGRYAVYTNKQDDQGNKGWYVYFKFLVEVDKVTGEEEDSINPMLGNEAMQGGKDATITFIDDISDISPNAKLVTWDDDTHYSPASNPCDVDYYQSSSEPWASYSTNHLLYQSIPTLKGVRDITCIANGTDVAITVNHVDATLTHAPTMNYYKPKPLPLGRGIALIGTMRVFIPVEDVLAGNDHTVGTADDGALYLTNCAKEFNPVGISGTMNFDGSGETTIDNCNTDIRLIGFDGLAGKNFRKGWSYQADQAEQWGGGKWNGNAPDASSYNTGDGTVTPGALWGDYVYYLNRGWFGPR